MKIGRAATGCPWSSRQVVIGRGGVGYWVDVKLDTSADVSREHVRLRCDEASGQFFLKDMSTLGTTIDGVRVPPSIEIVDGVRRDRQVEVPLPARARIGLADTVVHRFRGRRRGMTLLYWARYAFLAALVAAVAVLGWMALRRREVAGMAATTLRAHGASHPGRDRANNEDRLFHDAARGIFIVADGMGGHAAGERAADTTVAVLRARLEPIDGPPAERLREAFTLANNEVHRLAGTNPAWHGMAAVATAAIVRGSRVTVGHVGDTRAYSLRNGSLRKITRDHSPVGEREDRGEISEHDAMRHPRRHEVYRDIGSQPREPADSDFVEIAEFPFEDDTALLLCTDGLTDLVPSDVIARVIREHAGDGASVAERLVDAANAAGGRDNVSVVYVEGPAFAASVPNWPAGPSTPFAPPGARGGAWSTRAALIGSGILGALLLIWLAAQFTDRVPDWLLGQTRPRAWSRTWTVGAGDSADGSHDRRRCCRWQGRATRCASSRASTASGSWWTGRCTWSVPGRSRRSSRPLRGPKPAGRRWSSARAPPGDSAGLRWPATIRAR